MGQCYCQSPNGHHDLPDDSDTEDSDSEEYETFNELNSLGEMNAHRLTKFLLSLYLQRLPDALKTITMNYLGDDEEELLDLQYPFNSTILTTKEKYNLLSVMQRHLKNRSITFKLIYRASQDGYSAQDFHRKCDKYDYTIHIIEPLSNTQNKNLSVFGGFTSIPISNIEKEHRDPYMFLFRIRSDYRSPELIAPNIYHRECSFQYHWRNYIKTHTHSMISFGTKGENNKYLFIDDRCDWRNNYVGNDHLTKWQSDTIGYSVKEQQRLYFRVKEMEVFQVEQLFINKGVRSNSDELQERTQNLTQSAAGSSGDELRSNYDI